MNHDHANIFAIYKSNLKGLLNYYSFAANISKVWIIFLLLRASCAITLAIKYTLGTMRKAFYKFVTSLKYPYTDKVNFIPDSLKVCMTTRNLYRVPCRIQL